MVEDFGTYLFIYIYIQDVQQDSISLKHRRQSAGPSHGIKAGTFRMSACFTA